jgi:DNA invertase Pin-like site-specific DNA recombinase
MRRAAFGLFDPTDIIQTRRDTGGAMWQMDRSTRRAGAHPYQRRTRAGVKAAQRRGVKFGRKPKLTPKQIDRARKLIDVGERREDVAAILNVDRTTLYRALAG